MINDVMKAALLLGVMGGLFGIMLAIASKVFAVEMDPKVVDILDALPGANCGACGFPGCEGLANAIAAGNAPVNGCAIGGQDVADNVADIMGVNAGNISREVAVVKCQGDCDKAVNKYDYHGIQDCRLISDISLGSKGCSFGCVGGGSCVAVCEFDAIHLVNGIAVVDKEKCVACKKCIITCPKNIIELMPYESQTVVKCNSTDPGKIVRVNCSVGCIGCKICEKSCPKDAIHVENNLAKIDYEKCINCGICASKCPTNAIFVEYKERVEKMKLKAAEQAKAKAEAAKAAKAKEAENTSVN